MRITSLDIKNNLPIHRAKIINILDFNSEKLSVIKNNKNKIHVYYNHNPLFLAIGGLKGYFEKHDDANSTIFGSKKDQYLTIIFMNQHQKLMYTGILKKLIKILIEIMLKLNLNLMTMYLYIF